MKDSEVLKEAADMLEREGWAQGTFGDSERGYCMVGAIAKKAYSTHPAVTIEKACKWFGVTTSGLTTWNDDWRRKRTW